nr:hypothetical protein [Nitrosomonas nitrosa]
MVLQKLIPLLEPAAHNALRHVLATGAVAFGQSPPTKEPDFVAAFVLGGTVAIATAWSAILRPHRISMTIQSVYCHGSPLVVFPPTRKGAGLASPSRCELADLLLVIDDTTAGSPPARRASLVQAKMAASTSGSITLSGTDLVQLDLMQNWPTFTFPDKGYDPRTRNFAGGVLPPVAQSSGRYGLIDRGLSPPDWQQVAPAHKMTIRGVDLGAFLARMADRPPNAEGRAATIGGTDDWSFTIEELLKVTGVRTFKRPSITTRQLRGASHLLHLIVPEPSGTSLRLGYRWSDRGGGADLPPIEDVPPRNGISSVWVRFGNDE